MFWFNKRIYIQGQFLSNQTWIIHFCIMQEIPWLCPAESFYNCEEMNSTARGTYMFGGVCMSLLNIRLKDESHLVEFKAFLCK